MRAQLNSRDKITDQLGAEWMDLDPELEFDNYDQLIEFLEENTMSKILQVMTYVGRLKKIVGDEYLIELNVENDSTITLYRLV